MVGVPAAVSEYVTEQAPAVSAHSLAIGPADENFPVELVEPRTTEPVGT